MTHRTGDMADLTPRDMADLATGDDVAAIVVAQQGVNWPLPGVDPQADMFRKELASLVCHLILTSIMKFKNKSRNIISCFFSPATKGTSGLLGAPTRSMTG